MRPCDLFVATVSTGRDAVLLICLDGGKLTVLGSSVPIAGKHQNLLTSVAIAPPAGKTGVVAVRTFSTRRSNHKGGEWHAFLLKVEMGDQGPRIDLETPFIPAADRLGSADWIGVQVQIGETSFITWQGDKSKPNIMYVPDADLLCRYLVGEATAEEVKAAAEQSAVEISAQQELTRLRKEVDRLMGENTCQAYEQVKLLKQIATLIENLERSQSDHARSLRDFEHWRTQARHLKTAAEKMWFRGQVLNAALAAFPKET